MIGAKLNNRLVGAWKGTGARLDSACRSRVPRPLEQGSTGMIGECSVIVWLEQGSKTKGTWIKASTESAGAKLNGSWNKA